MATSLTFGSGSGGVGQANITLAVSFTFAENAGSPFNYDLKNANSPLYIQSVDLSTGANTITVPSGAGGVVIVPPTANASTITVKGVNGDTGVGIHPAVPTFLCFPASAPATFVLTAGGAITGLKLHWV